MHKEFNPKKKIDIEIIEEGKNNYTVKLNDGWLVNMSGLVHLKSKELAVMAAVVWLSHSDLNMSEVIYLLEKGNLNYVVEKGNLK